MGYLEEECKGCMGALKDPEYMTLHGGSCSMLPRTKTMVCPCLQCLVKVICEKDCFELKDYHIKTKKYRRIPYESD